MSYWRREGSRWKKFEIFFEWCY